MKRLLLLAMLAMNAQAADIVFDDGRVVTVPDEWVWNIRVKVRPQNCPACPTCPVYPPPSVNDGFADCAADPQHPKCLRQVDELMGND